MSKKVIIVIIVIILLGGIGFLLIPKEEKSKTENGIIESKKDNSKVSSNTKNQNEKMVYIEQGKTSNFDKGY